jgi:hypothetical protein
MDVLEIPRGRCNVHGRKESERLSQCLICGSLVWSRGTDGEPECRCSIATVMRDVAKQPYLAGTSA